MRKLLIPVLMLSFMAAGTAYCHYSWVDFDNFSPLPGAEVKIFLCNGHYFPKSEIALKDRLITDKKIISCEGNISTFTTVAEKTIRKGSVVFEDAGTHVVTFSLMKPVKKEPLFCAKSIITVGSGVEEDFSYELGQVFEIVPQKAISLLKEGDSLPLKLLYKGKPLKSSLLVTVMLDKPVLLFITKKNFTLGTGSDGKGVLRIKKAGKYLVTAEHKGRGCSLTFYVGQD